MGPTSSTTIYSQLVSIINNSMLADIGQTEFREHTYTIQENDKHTLLVKRLLNYYISYEHREKIIDQLMAMNQREAIDDYSRSYLTVDNIREMHENGMLIGSHRKSSRAFEIDQGTTDKRNCQFLRIS